MVEFVDLEFGTHGFLKNHVFLPTEQVETNICWIIYQDATFKICLTLFGWKENLLPKMHIVQWGRLGTVSREKIAVYFLQTAPTVLLKPHIFANMYVTGGSKTRSKILYCPFLSTGRLNLWTKKGDYLKNDSKNRFPFRRKSSWSWNSCAAQYPHFYSKPDERPLKMKINGKKTQWWGITSSLNTVCLQR